MFIYKYGGETLKKIPKVVTCIACLCKLEIHLTLSLCFRRNVCAVESSSKFRY